MATTTTTFGLLIFLAIVVGEMTKVSAFFMDWNNEAERCQKIAYRDSLYTPCIPTKSYKSCLESIDTDDAEEKNLILVEQTFVNGLLNSCPGFTDKKKCLITVSRDCKQDFEKKRLFLDKTVCGELEGVRDCLRQQLKGVCTEETITGEITDVDDLEKECKSGTLHGAPCTEDNIKQCKFPYNFDDYGYCNEKDLANANTCYTAMQKKCNRVDHQKLIQEDWAGKNSSCEPWTSGH